MRGHGGIVRVGNGLDDGEAEAEPAITVPSFVAESLEGLEEPRDVAGRDDMASVRDGQHSASCVSPGRDFDAAVGDVVADRVRYEVGRESLEESWIADRDSRLERHDAIQVAPLVGVYRFTHDRRHVDRLSASESPLALSEVEKGRDHAFLLLAAGDDALAHRAKRGDIRVRIDERRFRQRERKRDRCAQFVRNVGGEAIRQIELGPPY